jgi:uncharacterized protein YuzE
MTIRFSRHARWRMTLYNIEEKDIESIIDSHLAGKELPIGKHTLIDRRFISKYAYPLKVVLDNDGSRIFVPKAWLRHHHHVPFEERKITVKVYYDKQADAAYIQLSSEKPEGVVEISEGLNVDMTADNKVVGIEILDASRKISLNSLFAYELDHDLVGLEK